MLVILDYTHNFTLEYVLYISWVPFRPYKVKTQAPWSLSFSGSGWRSGSSFQMNNYYYYFPLSVQGNLIVVNIDIVNVVLDLKWILKYMLETIKYNKVDPVI